MKRRQWLRASLGLGALAGLSGLAPAVTALHWRRRFLVGFGTTLSIQAAHENIGILERGLDAGIETLRRIEQQMSLFNSDSALSRLNREGQLRSPPAELVEILDIAHGVSRDSNGAFEITVQPLWIAFDSAQRAG
ncbi:MAG: FAD:protein FMN transferase, partial [Variovorax sp.]